MQQILTFYCSNGRIFSIFFLFVFDGLEFKLPSEQKMLNSGLGELAELQFIFFPPVASSSGIEDLPFSNQQSHVKERATSGQNLTIKIFIKYYHTTKLLSYRDKCLNSMSYISQTWDGTNLQGAEHVSIVFRFHSLYNINHILH